MKSEFDVSTVVSILPIAITETKPGLIPGMFSFPAVEENDFFLLPITRCHHPVYLDESRPSLLVPDPSDEVANSIVEDYKQSSLLFESGVTEPGLAWVHNGYENIEIDKERFKIDHKDVLISIYSLQINWFEALVKIADDSWSEEHQHNHISDLSRLAAVRLGLKEKEWLVREQVEKAQSKCSFCFTIVHPEAIVCSSCHADLKSNVYRNVLLGGSSEQTSEVSVSQDRGSSEGRETGGTESG